MSGVYWVTTYDHESKDRICYAYIAPAKPPEYLPAGWVLCVDGNWVARTSQGIRADFDSKEEAISFLTLLVGAGN